MAVARARAAALLLLALHTFSIFAATLQASRISVSNTSSPDAASLPVIDTLSNYDENGDCFNSAEARRGLHPAKLQDCLNAVRELYDFKTPFRPIIFARRKRVGFMLPQVFRNGSCVISIDVMNDADSDTFRPWVVYTAAKEIALRCTQSPFLFGGRAKTGPLKVVDVLVFGRVWPPENGAVEPVTSDIVAGERLISRDSNLLKGPPPSVIRPTVVNNTGHDNELGLDAAETGSGLRCYDPPLPRERVWPINSKDCEKASEAIIGGRARDQRYTFSRQRIDTKLYYPLPVTNRYRSCVVHLDMSNNSERDTVRLSIVEATAWVLAHKCSGEEKAVERYGGWGKVATGSKGLIKVWVYGRVWPPPVGAKNVTSLVLAQPASLIDSER